MRTKVFFLTITLAILMGTTVYSEEIEVSFPVIEEHLSGMTVDEVPSSPWVIDSGVNYGITVSDDPLDPGNNVLKFIREPEMAAESGNRPIRIVLDKAESGKITLSWRMYLPQADTYNAGTDAENQGGIQVVADDGTVVFYNAILGNKPSFYLRYWNGTAQVQTQISLAHNQWHDFRGEFNLTDKTMEFFVDNTSKGAFNMQHFASGNSNIKTIEIYLHRNAVNTLMYFDDIYMTNHKIVAFEPSELVLDYTTPSVNYETRLLTTNGTISKFIDKDVNLTIINEETEAVLANISEGTILTDDDKAEFEFSYEIPDAVTGWHNIIIASDYIETPVEERTTRVYIASVNELTNLPSDFSVIPSDVSDAKDLIAAYIPMIASGEDAKLFTDSGENAEFIAKYFQSANKNYTLISEVQAEYLKACEYLNLSILSGASLTDKIESFSSAVDYVTTDIFKDNKDEFTSHFIKYREGKQMLSDSDIAPALRYSFAMTALNNAKKSEIKGIIAEYNDDIFKLAISSDEILKLNQDELYSSLFNKSYDDVDDIKTDFDNKAKTLVPPPPPPNKGSSGGGGSAGGGYFKAESTIEDTPKVLPTVQEDELIDDATGELPNTPIEDKELFTDVQGHWAEASINNLAKDKIITGYSDKTFKPENTVTRAEFVTMLVKMFTLTAGEITVEYSDVSETDWFYDSVVTATITGIVNGSGGKFLPNEPVTREQLAVMLQRATNIPVGDNAKTEPSDFNNVSEYARDAVVALYTSGIVSGYEDGSFQPQKPATRAEVAKLLSDLKGVDANA